tara:strand:+ start:362 stop:544 length:183 start_codon:yes stop_codon:yes gene_type:complete
VSKSQPGDEELVFVGSLLEVVAELMLEADGEQTYAIITEGPEDYRKGEGRLILIPPRADA